WGEPARSRPDRASVADWIRARQGRSGQDPEILGLTRGELAHPDGDDAVAVLLQGHAAVVISVGTPLSTQGSALGVIARREGIATRQTQRCEQQQYPHVALPQLCSGCNAAD